MESFCLSQSAESETSSSPYSGIHSDDGKDCFGLDISDFDVPFNFHSELTRLDMASSALEYLENLNSPNQTRLDPMEVNSTNSTLDQQYKPDVPSGSQLWPKEMARREPEVFHFQYGIQIRPKEMKHFAPDVVPAGSHFPCSAPHWQQEAKCPDKEWKRRRSTVPDECKDALYWRKRSKNNISAKKSRAAKRARDIFIANKIDQLEKENSMLKVMLTNIMMQQQQQQNHFVQRQ